MTAASPASDVDPGKYPRVAAYLDGLPTRLGSHLNARSKASIYLALLEQPGTGLDPTGLPEPLGRLVRSPPLKTAWIPTVWVNALELAVADLCRSDARFLEIAYAMNCQLLASPMYRALVRVMSPAMLLRMARMVWSRFHQGSQMALTVEPKQAWLSLEYPVRLHPRLIAEEKATAYRAAIEAAGGQQTVCEVLDYTDERCRFHARWR